VKIRLRGRQGPAKARHAPGTTSAPEPAGVTWAHAELRDQIQRIWDGESPAQPAIRQVRDTDRSPVPDREAEP
jgi:hypothetical protein